MAKVTVQGFAQNSSTEEMVISSPLGTEEGTVEAPVEAPKKRGRKKKEASTTRGNNHMIYLKVNVLFVEDTLGTAPGDKDIYTNFIASNAPDALSREEEIESLGADEVMRKDMTVFNLDPETGRRFCFDYQWKGYLKDTVGMIRKESGTACSGLTAHKKKIDGNITVLGRKIFYDIPDEDEVGICERPLKASTPQGERIALARSESIPAGTTLIVEFVIHNKEDEQWVMECLDRGIVRGFSQWRNSGKGRFVYEVLERDDTYTEAKLAENLRKQYLDKIEAAKKRGKFGLTKAN